MGLVVEARGFFCQQGALVSGVSACLGHLPLLGQVVLEWGVVLVISGNLCKEYKTFSKVTYTDKYIDNS